MSEQETRGCLQRYPTDGLGPRVIETQGKEGQP
jgi:hypothetical protein